MSHEDPERPLSLTDGRVPRFAALVREAVAVLTAILIAFALDAWWDDRVEHRTMLDALDAVAIELDRNVLRLDSAITFNQNRADVVISTMDLDPGAVDDLSDEDLARYADLPDYSLATLDLGAVTAFIEGGFLASLDDRELRANLAGLPRLQVEMDEEAAVVWNASERLNEVLLMSSPIEDFLRPAGPNAASSIRSILRTLTANEDARRALFARTFFLVYLYGPELQVTMERLAFVGDQIQTYVAQQ